MKKHKGNMLVTFILLTALSFTVFAIVSMMAVRMRESNYRIADVKAFNIAEAGLEKAIWYLNTSKGTSWRTGGTTESFSVGKYTISVVTSATNEVRIVSTGDVNGVTKTVTQRVAFGGAPAAFEYAIYTGSQVALQNNVQVYGDMYVNGNTTLTGSSGQYDGKIYHPAGTTITDQSSGGYTDGGAPSSPVSPPTFDDSSYTALINTAKAQSPGGLDYNTANQVINLNGATIYVNGYVHTNASGIVFNGPGKVVASGDITFNNDVTINGGSGVQFIAGNGFSTNGNLSATGATFYSATTITNNNTSRIDVGAMIAIGNMNINGALTMSGLLFSEGTITLQGNPQITGAICSSGLSAVEYLNSGTITFDQTKIPTNLPTGFTGGSTNPGRVKRSWKGL